MKFNMDWLFDYWPLWLCLAALLAIGGIGYLDTTVWAPQQQARIVACHEKGGVLMYDRDVGRVCATKFERVP